MSQDLQTYATMSSLATSSNVSDDPYIAQSDSAELERLRALTQAQGLGDTLQDDEELREMIGEIGFSGLDLDVNVAEDK